MGRTEPTIVKPPAAFRRDARAKQAKATINKLIPSLLPAHPRARRGIEASELIVAPPPTAQSSPCPPPRLSIRATDTLTAAQSLFLSSTTNNNNSNNKNVAILNMASPLSPGGGFLNGATSQEEALCMRTTLLPALRDEFYRLPELGCVYTPDVLVFRDSENENNSDEQHGELHKKKDRWYVDVVSAAMLRLPETEVVDDEARYVHAKDRELVLDKMRAVLRVLVAKGAARVVLGAWGCGAYGNPVNEIAKAWRRVLLGEASRRGSKKKKGKTTAVEQWSGIQEIVFAIKDVRMAEAFHEAFGEGLTWIEDEDKDSEGCGDGEDGGLDDLLAKIEELRLRIDRAPNPRVKEGLQAVLVGLESQMPRPGSSMSSNSLDSS